VLDVVEYPNQTLLNSCVTVTQFDPSLAAFAEQMMETMYAYGGVGLAAPQVGDARRLLVVDSSDGKDSCWLMVLVNPRITKRSSEVEAGEEGCLSLPGVKLMVPRSLAIDVEYHDLKGKLQLFSFSGLHSRIIQHEVDHLDGKMMLDRVGPMQRRQALKDLPKGRRGKDGVDKS
jgi:peptide deformylase